MLTFIPKDKFQVDQSLEAASPADHPQPEALLAVLRSEGENK